MSNLFVNHAFAATITINTGLPGPNNQVASSSLGAFISNFYTFALLIAGILAFGAIVYGGIRYAVSGGNPSKQSEARSWITNALLGLLLLAGAYVILYTINPTLTSLALPNLPALNAASPSGTSNELGNSANSQSSVGTPNSGCNPACTTGYHCTLFTGAHYACAANTN